MVPLTGVAGGEAVCPARRFLRLSRIGAKNRNS